MTLEDKRKVVYDLLINKLNRIDTHIFAFSELDSTGKLLQLYENSKYGLGSNSWDNYKIMLVELVYKLITDDSKRKA